MTLPDLNEISKEIYSYQVGNYCHVLSNSETVSYRVRICAVPSLCAVIKFIPIAYSPVHVISKNLVWKLQTTITKHVLGYYSWTGYRMWLKHNVINRVSADCCHSVIDSSINGLTHVNGGRYKNNYRLLAGGGSGRRRCGGSGKPSGHEIDAHKAVGQA